MKNSLKIFSLIVAVSGCATAQKTAKVDMEPLPMKIHHSDESAGGYYKLGQYFQNTQRPDRALQAYQDALKVEPNDIKTDIATAVLNAKRGDYSTSISQLKSLVNKFPEDASLYNNLGYTYYLSGDYRNAVSALGKAIVIDPTNVHALNNMGAALNKLGQPDHALKYINLAKTIRTGEIKSAEKLTPSSSVKSKPEINYQVQNYKTLASKSLIVEPDVSQNQVISEIKISNNSTTKINQISSGIYELVIAETYKEVVKTSAFEPLSEAKVLVQSGGVSFKVHPLVNNLFNENASVIAGNNYFDGKTFTLEIVNGNGVKDFARKTSETLVEIGLNQTSHISDKKSYNQHETILQYREGFLDDAVKLGKTLNKMPVLVKLNTLPNNADLCLVLGRDVINHHYNQQVSSA